MCRPTSRTKKQMPTSRNQNSQSRCPREGLTVITGRLVKRLREFWRQTFRLRKYILAQHSRPDQAFPKNWKRRRAKSLASPEIMSAYLAQIYQSSILIVLGYSETIVLQMGMSQSHFTTQFWKEFLEKSTIYFAKFKKEFPMELALTS